MAAPVRKPHVLPPRVRKEVQRILDREARRILDEQLARDKKAGAS